MSRPLLSNEDFLRAQEEIVEDIAEIMVEVQMAHAKVKVAQNMKEVYQAVTEAGCVDIKEVVSSIYAKYLTPEPKKHRGRPPGSKNKIKKGE